MTANCLKPARKLKIEDEERGHRRKRVPWQSVFPALKVDLPFRFILSEDVFQR